MKSSLFALALLAGSASAVAPVVAQPTARSTHADAGLMSQLKFLPDQATMPVGASTALSRVAGWAKDNPDGLIVLDLYPDTAKTDAKLVVRRGEVVREALAKAGVDAARIAIAVYPRPTHPGRLAIWSTKEDLDAVRHVVSSRGGRVRIDPLARR